MPSKSTELRRLAARLSVRPGGTRSRSHTCREGLGGGRQGVEQSATGQGQRCAVSAAEHAASRCCSQRRRCQRKLIPSAHHPSHSTQAHHQPTFAMLIRRPRCVLLAVRYSSMRSWRSRSGSGTANTNVCGESRTSGGGQTGERSGGQASCDARCPAHRLCAAPAVLGQPEQPSASQPSLCSFHIHTPTPVLTCFQLTVPSRCSFLMKLVYFCLPSTIRT